MNKLILNFFGEEVKVDQPKTLQNLKQEISNKFFFSYSDASEILVSYIKDLKRTFIRTEQDFIDFIKKHIYKVDLDISPDSQLYKKSILKLQEENDKDKKELEVLIKVKEELEKKKKVMAEERKKTMKEIGKKIKELNRKKCKFIKQTKIEKEKITGEINSTNEKIVDLQKKLGIPITVEEKKKPKTEKSKPKPKVNTDKKAKKTVAKKVVKKNVKKADKKPIEKKLVKVKDIFATINEAIKKMSENITKLVTEQLNKKTKEIEDEKKKIEDSKIQLKEEEIKGFFDFTSVSKNISEEINKWTKFVTQHTNELTNALSQKYNNCINAITSLKKIENEKLKAPAPKKTVTKIHKGVKCQKCGQEPIVGNRFKCSVCSNLNYCEKCEEENKDLHLHPFIKIYSPQMAL